MIAWQYLPELGGRYLFFLNNEDDESPNYKILTGYQLKNGIVNALDNHPSFREFNGMSEADFVSQVKEAIQKSSEIFLLTKQN